MINFLQSLNIPSHFPKITHNEKHICTKTTYYSPPLTKLGGRITGMKGNQIKDMKRKNSALTVKYNNVKNSGVL